MDEAERRAIADSEAADLAASSAGVSETSEGAVAE
jgi:hypothetical protein